MREKKINQKVKSTGADRIFNICNYLFLVAVTLAFLIPFWTVFASSFISKAEAAKRGSFILMPHKFDITAYKLLLSGGSAVYRAYANTLFLVTVGTAVNLILTVTMAYPLSKKQMPGNSLITFLVFLTMIFNGGLIPTFLLNKELGLMDSMLALILPNGISAWNMLIMRNFFSAFPEALEEAAKIDGASPFETLVKIVLPLSLPVIATIGLFYAVAHWNSWFNAAIYINDKNKLPVQNILRNMIASSTGDVGMESLSSADSKPTATAMKSAMIVISTVPIICVYPFIQKYFVKGVLVGSVKG
ncbi:MAG: carbohydrate ABC transporter permease [Firmicutes bacterium]|nr:carbohydrate ABC transporter permease [Bacillota bacterium]